MCFGWEMGVGWFDKMKELSMKLEAINLLFYPKFGVHIVMEQSKQKWGYLTNYFRVDVGQPRIVRLLNAPFKSALRWLSTNVDYDLKRVIDDEGGDYDVYEEIFDEDMEQARDDAKKFDNVRIESLEGRWFRVTKRHRFPSSHYEPSKHKVLFALKGLLLKATSFLDFAVEPSASQTVVAEAVELIAREHIRQAEHECYCICEQCGTQIGTEWSPRIQTEGWISYICEKCDAERRISSAKDAINRWIGKNKDNVVPAETNDELKKIEELSETDRFVTTSDMVKAAKRIEEIANGLIWTPKTETKSEAEAEVVQTEVK